MTLPDRFINQAAPDAMYADAELAMTDIVATALQAVGMKIEPPVWGRRWMGSFALKHLRNIYGRKREEGGLSFLGGA